MSATADNRTLARPYARAVFEKARTAGNLSEWGETLAALGAVAGHVDVRKLIGNPNVDQAELAGHMAAIAGRDDEATRAFLALLAENKRLSILPAIAEQFEAQRAAAEGWVEVEVTAAAEVSADLQSRLSDALAHRLGREVRLRTATDEELIGGAVIRAGDLVIDGSVRSQLQRMQQSLAR